MRAMFDIRPIISTDTVNISATDNSAGYDVTNLKNIQPMKMWKSLNASGAKVVLFDFGTPVTFSGFFLNRFNFSAFTLGCGPTSACGNNGIIVTDATQDECSDETYMHYYGYFGSPQTYRYWNISIPNGSPLFGETTYRIGNVLFGTDTEIYGVKPGFKISTIPKLDVVEFPSGYQSVYKLGRTKHVLEGGFDKMALTEMAKIKQTFNPFVFYSDINNNKNEAYLVKQITPIGRSYDFNNAVNRDFQLSELI